MMEELNAAAPLGINISPAEERNSKKKEKKRKEKKRNHDSEAVTIVNGAKNNDSSSTSKKENEKVNKKKQKKDHGSSLEAHRQKPINSQDEASISLTPAANARKPSSSQRHEAIVQSTALTLSAKSPASSNNLICSKLRRSPYQMKTILGTVALLPSSTSNVIKHIQSLLHSLLLMYDSNMGGVLLSLQGGEKKGEGSCVKLLPVNNKIVSSLIGGRFVNDLPYVHFRFQAKGLLFCPKVGMKLQGQVVECTPTYVTLTTHHILSTKISAEKLQESDFFYNSKNLEWTKKSDGYSIGSPIAAADGGWGEQEKEGKDDGVPLGRPTSLYLDYTVEFVVERIYECGGYISLDGSHPFFVSKLG